MAAVYRELIAHQNRAGHVVSDVVAALKRGRLCMVLTQGRDHVDDFQRALRDQGFDPVVLRGGMGAKAR